MSQLAGVSIQQPTEAQCFRVAAEAMLAGARPLANVAPQPSLALTLLCGHGTESALKALLAQTGLTAAQLSHSPYGHNLVALWDKAISARAPVANPRPQWLDHLHRVYATPFHLRYPLGFHGIVLPNMQLMLAGFESLVLAAVEEIK